MITKNLYICKIKFKCMGFQKITLEDVLYVNKPTIQRHNALC